MDRPPFMLPRSVYEGGTVPLPLELQAEIAMEQFRRREEERRVAVLPSRQREPWSILHPAPPPVSPPPLRQLLTPTIYTPTLRQILDQVPRRQKAPRSFPSTVVDAAWRRAAGQRDGDFPQVAYCECKRVSHGHGRGRCDKRLVWANRGRERPDFWEANHRHRHESYGTSTLGNAEIVCWGCHRQMM